MTMVLALESEYVKFHPSSFVNQSRKNASWDFEEFGQFSFT